MCKEKKLKMYLRLEYETGHDIPFKFTFQQSEASVSNIIGVSYLFFSLNAGFFSFQCR